MRCSDCTVHIKRLRHDTRTVLKDVKNLGDVPLAKIYYFYTVPTYSTYIFLVHFEKCQYLAKKAFLKKNASIEFVLWGGFVDDLTYTLNRSFVHCFDDICHVSQ